MVRLGVLDVALLPNVNNFNLEEFLSFPNREVRIALRDGLHERNVDDFQGCVPSCELAVGDELQGTVASISVAKLDAPWT